MHSFNFVPPENRAPAPLWVKLGSGETVMARDAIAGAAPPEAVTRHVLREFCRVFISKAFPGGVEAWGEQFLNKAAPATLSPARFKRVGETTFGVPGGVPLRPDLIVNDRDWPAPQNNYTGRCCSCFHTYFGPKRSNICWTCKDQKPLSTGR